MALTADQIGFYQDNGYLLLEQAIPSSVLTSLRETVDRFIEASRAIEASNGFMTSISRIQQIISVSDDSKIPTSGIRYSNRSQNAARLLIPCASC